MAINYVKNKLYFLKNYMSVIATEGEAVTYLNIWGNSFTGNTQEIKLYSKVSTDPMQKWFLNRPNASVERFYLCTACDGRKGINMYSLNDPRCTIYNAYDNDNDGLIELVQVSAANNNIFYIKLVNRNKYLTATNYTQGSAVVWSDLTNSDLQKWMFEVAPVDSDIIDPPSVSNPSNVNILAKYRRPLPFTGTASSLCYEVDKIPDNVADAMDGIVDGYESNVKFHKASGFTDNVQDFEASHTEIINIIKDAVRIMYARTNVSSAQVCYNLFGEWDDTYKVHHGVDMSIGENLSIRALITGTVLYKDPGTGALTILNDDNTTISCYHHLNSINVNEYYTQKVH